MVDSDRNPLWAQVAERMRTQHPNIRVRVDEFFLEVRGCSSTTTAPQVNSLLEEWAHSANGKSLNIHSLQNADALLEGLGSLLARRESLPMLRSIGVTQVAASHSTHESWLMRLARREKSSELRVLHVPSVVVNEHTWRAWELVLSECEQLTRLHVGEVFPVHMPLFLDRAVRFSTSLEELRLDEFFEVDNVTGFISKLVSKMELKFLSLGNGTLDDKACIRFAKSLRNDVVLEGLDLRDIEVSDEGLRQILDGLFEHPALRTLLLPSPRQHSVVLNALSLEVLASQPMLHSFLARHLCIADDEETSFLSFIENIGTRWQQNLGYAELNQKNLSDAAKASFAKLVSWAGRDARRGFPYQPLFRMTG
ncbi:MAG: hypothetical protein GY822_21240 [Deltaproteobacteria bacterium]|nr:hypothetical protein [Deltaproteobacteria bacterium]